MADCCAELRSELVALKAEVRKLGKVDEESIIIRAVERADRRLRPPINEASALAGDAFGLADNAFGVATLAASGIAALVRVVAPLGPAIAALGARLAALAAGLSAAVASIAAIAAALAGALAAIALIYALSARVNALEGYVNAVATTANGAFDTAIRALGVGTLANKKADSALGQIPAVRDTANSAKSAALEALAKIPGVAAIANAALSLAGLAQSAASDALSQIPGVRAAANKALDLAGSVYSLADNAVKKAENALSQVIDVRATANNALTLAGTAESKANDALGQLPGVRSTANNALTLAGTAESKANDALRQLPGIRSTADKALSSADIANGKADSALKEIPAVKVIATNALTVGIDAKVTASQALAIAQAAALAKSIPGPAGAPGQSIIGPAGAAGAPGRSIVGPAGAAGAPGKDAPIDSSLVQRITNVEIQIKEQETLNKQGLTLIQQLPTVLQPTIVNSVTKTVDAVVGKSIEQAVADVKASFKAVADTNAAALAPQFQKTIDANRAAIAALSIPLLGGVDNINKGVSSVVSTVSVSTNVGTKKIEQALTDIQGDLDLQNTGTKRTLDELVKVGGLIAALPLAFVRNPAVQTAAVTAARTAVCESAAPGGCTDVMQRRNNNNLRGDILGGLNAGLGALNAGANALQLNALRAIQAGVNAANTKLGPLMNGANGISGFLSRVSTSMGVDRALNLIAIAANLHNAMMLSANLKITLLEMLSSVGNATGVLQTPDNENVDLNQVFNAGIEAILIKIVGIDSYAGLKVGLRKHNAIYQAATNSLNAVSGMLNSLGNVVEQGAEYTGRIGNALKGAGMVAENSYKWMSEKFDAKSSKFIKFESKIGDVTQILETINEIAETVVEGQQAATEFQKANTDFIKAVEDAKRSPLTPENKEVKAEAEKAKENATKDPTGEVETGLLSFLTN